MRKPRALPATAAGRLSGEPVGSLVGHKRRRYDELFVWSAGIVSRRWHNGREFAWRPDGGAERFMHENTIRRVEESSA